MAKESKKKQKNSGHFIKDFLETWRLFVSPKGFVVQISFGGVFLFFIMLASIFLFVSPPRIYEKPTISASIPANFFKSTGLVEGDTGDSNFIENQPGTEGAPKSDLPPMPGEFSELLLPHPDPALVENSDLGLMPVIGTDGRESWFAYGRPTNVFDIRPKIGVIVANLGFSNSLLGRVLAFPPDTTLAYSPYSQGLANKINDARGNGFEVMLMMPMEPNDYPLSDPGFMTLLTRDNPAELLDKTHMIMGKASGYIGMLDHLGDAFVVDDKGMREVLQELKNRGLAFIDSGSSLLTKSTRLSRQMELPSLLADKHVDVAISEAEFNNILAEIENIAMESGSALLIIDPIPNLMQPLKSWLQTLPERDIALAPVSGILRLNNSQFEQNN